MALSIASLVHQATGVATACRTRVQKGSFLLEVQMLTNVWHVHPGLWPMKRGCLSATRAHPEPRQTMLCLDVYPAPQGSTLLVQANSPASPVPQGHILQVVQRSVSYALLALTMKNTQVLSVSLVHKGLILLQQALIHLHSANNHFLAIICHFTPQCFFHTLFQV
mmetsp:Transcript_30378/g.38086  ORF Transcript_30378/g.38086 Transcript_30378/m.38086 type:complete len:165 (+) Transcript_30378:1159-1653(+)